MADKSEKRSPLETAGGAYVGYRRAGRRPESQQDREASANIPVAVARGLVSGTLGLPGDIESLARLPYELITGKESKTILPTSEDIEKRLPFRGASQTPVGQMFTGAGQLAGGAYTGPLSGARAVMAVPRAIKRAGQDFVQSAGQTVSPLTVYHGSPHKFDRFDASKIGTGEGAQSYGHGLYLAESPGVAKSYRRNLSSSVEVPEGTPALEKRIAEMAVNFGGDDPIAWLQKYEKGAGHTVPALTPELVASTIKKFESGEFRPGGNLYTVDLPDEKIARMLDWDKPLSEQPEVIKALKGTDYEVGMSQREAEKIADMRLRQEADEWADMTGGDPVDYSNNVDWEKYVDQVRKESGSIDSSITGKELHRMVMRDEGYRPELFDPENYQIGTSEALRGYGIPGIRYLDASSRDAGKGTSNFVVFPGEEDALTILERKKEGGSVSISDNPDAQMMDVMDKKLGGDVKMQAGGVARFLKGLKGTQEVLPAAERQANLAKFLEPSKVPQRLYHGTTASEGGKGTEAIRRFKPSKEGALGSGVYLTPDPKFAGSYAEQVGSSMLPVYAQLKNPLILRGSGVPDKYKDPMIEALEILGMDSAKAAKMVERAYENKGYIGKEVQTRAQAQGYDGLIEYDRDGNLAEVVSYRPSAVKSAIGNKGTYDINKPELNEAAGGAVHMQAGGLARMAKAAKASKAAKAEPSLPLELPRAPAKTREEIRPTAQRMAQQMTGEFVRPDPKKSINPAGKSRVQFEMERGLTHDIRPTPGKALLPQQVADIEKQLGMLKIGVSGDTTIADKTLYRAGPYKLDLPSPQHGGPLYALGGEGAWASNNPVAATFQKRVQELSQANKEAPVLGQFLAMGPQGSNFAMHFADANLRAIDPKKMSKQQVEQFNKLIREGSEKSGPRPGFPGIEDKESAYLHFAFDPELRKHFNAMMQLPNYTSKLGLPDGRVILHAITEPELRNTEVLTSGLSQMRLDPSVNPADLMLSAHPTYSHVIPKVPGSDISRTRYPVPAELEFPDVAEFIKKNYRPRDATRVYQTATPRQMVDPQHIDEMKMYEELMKEYTGKKKGGAVNMQAGGLAKFLKGVKGTQKTLPAEERKANLDKMLEGSKVKERLYHGTGADISEFKPSVIGAMGPGTYLTKNPKVASEYGNVVNLRRSTNQPNVLPVYAQIKNPFEITRVNRSGSELFNRFDPSGKLTDDEVIELVKKAGYDAIHAIEDGEINVLDPRKIKSAIGNRGTYDISKPEINEAIGGLIKVKNKRKAKA